MPLIEKRRHARSWPPSHVAAWIAWTDEKGRTRHVAGKCLDISISGARIELPAIVRRGQQLTIGIPRIPVEAEAVVRRSDVNGLQSTIGVEFTARRDKRPNPDSL